MQVFVGKALDRVLLRQPVQRAVFHFITQTIARSVKHRLFLATYGGFGIALAVLSLGPNASAFLRLPLMLSFVMISGLRAAFNFPSELGANWAYQISESSDVGEYMVGCASGSSVRDPAAFPADCTVRVSAIPLDCGAVPPRVRHHARGAPDGDHVFRIPQGAIHVLLLSRQDHFLFGLSVLYVFGFTAYSRLMASLEVWFIGMPVAAIVFFIAAPCVQAILIWGSRRKLQDSVALDYEDAADPLVRTLGLGYY